MKPEGSNPKSPRTREKTEEKSPRTREKQSKKSRNKTSTRRAPDLTHAPLVEALGLLLRHLPAEHHLVDRLRRLHAQKQNRKQKQNKKNFQIK